MQNIFCTVREESFSCKNTDIEFPDDRVLTKVLAGLLTLKSGTTALWYSIKIPQHKNDTSIECLIDEHSKAKTVFNSYMCLLETFQNCQNLNIISILLRIN